MMIRVLNKVFGLAAVLATLLAVATAAAPVAAQTAPQVPIRAWDHGDYGRLVFDWPSKVGYSARIEDGALVVTFDRSLTPGFSGVSRQLPDYISQSVLSEDGRGVRFGLIGQFRLRSFVTDNAVVVDLIKSTPTADRPAAAPTPTTDRAARAEPAPDMLAVRIGAHPDYDRIVFDWATDVGYAVRQDGAAATVTFDKAARIDLPGLRAALPNSISGAEARIDGGQLVVTFTVDAASTLRDFRTGNKVVVDVMAPAAPKMEIVEAETPPEPETEVVDAVTPAENVEPETPADIDEPLDLLAAIEEPTDVAEIEPEELEVLPEIVSDDAGAEAEAEAEPDGAAIDALEEIELAEVSEEPIDEAFADEALDDPAFDDDAFLDDADLLAPDDEAVDETDFLDESLPDAPLLNVLSVSFEALEHGPRLRFDWDVPVAAAVFMRGSYLWAAFDAPTNLDFDAVDGASAIVTPAGQVLANGRTIARFLVADKYFPTVLKEDENWIIDLRASGGPTTPIPTVIEDGSQVGVRILLTTPEPGGEIVVTDPEIGDQLHIVPVASAGHGIAMGRRFVDLELLPSAQGVVVRPISDTVAVRALRDAVEIGSLSGLHFSPETERAAAAVQMQARQALETRVALESKKVQEEEDVPIFHFKEWGRVAKNNFQDSKKIHNVKLSMAPEESRYNQRLALAQFYFANALAPETLGMLRMAMTETPWLEIDPTVRAMRGAANVMLGRFEEATDDLFLEEFDSSLEMGVWRGAWYAQTGDLAAAAREFERSGRVIDRYPSKLRVDLRMLVAESLLATQQIGLADNFLDSILVDRPRQNVVDRVTYLRGLTTAAAGRPLEAIDILEKAAQSEDRYTRGLAEWARIEMMLEENMIGPDEAVVGLEALRFAWRGDEFELNLLHRLGNLYIVRGDYNSGLTTYRETISVFPDSAKVREIAQTMNDTFSALFLDGKADELPPISALAIYNDFRELTPVGNLGDQLIFRLSDRLVGVDLLEQASELLQHQVEFRLRGGDLARVGARLAGIYLLDQKPDRAVSALRASDVVRMPEALSQQRHYLLTRALAESGDVDKALGLLRGDQGREANLLRADIYWKTQDWLEEATVIERLFHDRDPDAPLDAMEGQYLIRMAVALALSNNRQALAELRERFGPMMRETVNGDAFLVLAAYVDSGPIDPSDLTSTLNEIDSYEAFMVSLREQVASETLSAVN